MWGSTLVKSLTPAAVAAWVSLSWLLWLNTGESIQERSRSGARSATRSFQHQVTWRDMRGATQEKIRLKTLPAQHAKRRSPHFGTFSYMGGSTLEKSHAVATSVNGDSLSSPSPAWIDIGGPIQVYGTNTNGNRLSLRHRWSNLMKIVKVYQRETPLGCRWRDNSNDIAITRCKGRGDLWTEMSHSWR